MKARFTILISIAVLLSGVFGVAAQDTFFGQTAEDLFPIPEVAETELEQTDLPPFWWTVGLSNAALLHN